MPDRLLLLLSLLFASTAFAQSADLTFNANPIDQRANRFSLIFAMTNQGPDVAKNAVLTVGVPPGVTVDRFSFGAGDAVTHCDTTQRPLRCNVGDMHVGFPFHYGGVDLSNAVAEGAYTLTFTLTSDTADPNPANNTASVTWEAFSEADVISDLNTTTVRRVDPGAAVDFTGMVCNNIGENRPPRVSVEFTATNGTIRSIEPPTGFTCTAESNSRSVCTVAQLPGGCADKPFVIRVIASEDRSGGETRLTMRSTSDIRDVYPPNNEESVAISVYRWLTVDKTADSGPGSLRQAMHDANAGCTPGPCRIVFEIPGPVPAEGWFTITPATPLPAITAARVSLEGRRQTAFTGDTNPKGPEIGIDGRLAGRGLHILAPCEGQVNGLAIGNFDEDQGLWISSGADCQNRQFDRREVVDNHIGVDPAGEVSWPNRRGLRADFSQNLTVSRNVISRNRFSGVWLWRGAATFTHNTIEDNGASGIFLGPEVFAAVVSDNAFRRNRDMGIAASRELFSLGMRRNVMQDNGGLGIDWGLDGVSPAAADDHQGPTNAPVLLSARYDAARNRTTVNLRLQSEPIGPQYTYGYLDFFANANPDGDGEQYIGSSGQVFQMEGTTSVSVPGDHRGRWLNATWTREHLPYATTPKIGTQSHPIAFMVMSSESSNAVLVE